MTSNRCRARALGLAVLCAASLPAAACEESLTGPSVVNILTGSSWTVRTISRAGASAAEPPGAERFTLIFGVEGQVSVQADCNRCSGSYTVADGRVTISPLACTRAFCQSAPVDTDYVAILGGESTVARRHGGLLLESDRGALQFKGRK